MTRQNRKTGTTKFRSAWNLLLILAGLIFASFGIGLVVSGFDVASKVIGVGVAAIGLYVLLLGLRRGVMVNKSGITVRQGIKSSQIIPWRDITSIEVGKTDYFFVQLCVPVVSLGRSESGESVELQPMAYYRIKSERESRHVNRLSSLLAEYR